EEGAELDLVERGEAAHGATPELAHRRTSPGGRSGPAGSAGGPMLHAIARRSSPARPCYTHGTESRARFPRAMRLATLARRLQRAFRGGARSTGPGVPGRSMSRRGRFPFRHKEGGRMNPNTVVVLAVAVVIVLVAAWMISSWQRSKRLRTQFGP